MDTVSRELSSLSLCLENLRNDSVKINYPGNIERTLRGVLQQREGELGRMMKLLELWFLEIWAGDCNGSQPEEKR
jgi:hypothetical protein